jgi:hypothetical protein
LNKKLTALNSRYLLIIFLFTVFSGAIRKWFLTDAVSKNIIFALQLLVPYIYFINNSFQIREVFTKSYLSIYLLVLVLLAINPLNETIFHGLIGILIHFSFWFLLFYYTSNRNNFNLSDINKIILLVIIFQLAIATLQYQLPADNILNSYADIEKVGGSIAVVGNSVRVTGSFSYISGYTSFLIFFNYFIWTIIKYKYKPYIIVAFVLFGFYANLISGSRGATYGYGIFLIMLIYFEKSFFNIRNFGRLILPLIILLLVITLINIDEYLSAFNMALNNFELRSAQGLESGETQFRIIWDLLNIINFQGNYPIFGVGLGSSYQGAIAIFGISKYVTDFGYVEGELIRIVLEGGFTLLICRIGLTILLLKQLNFPGLFKIVLFIQIAYQYQIIFNVYNTIFFALGLILLDSVSTQMKEGLLKINN